jgi:hypothetical protein
MILPSQVGEQKNETHHHPEGDHSPVTTSECLKHGYTKEDDEDAKSRTRSYFSE